MTTEVIGATAVGPMEKIPNLKKRQRAIYYRPFPKADGTVEWMATQLLPSDAQGRELYLSKGFRLSPPKPMDTVAPESVTVDQEKETLLAENTRLRRELGLAKAREVNRKKKETPS